MRVFVSVCWSRAHLSKLPHMLLVTHFIRPQAVLAIHAQPRCRCQVKGSKRQAACHTAASTAQRRGHRTVHKVNDKRTAASTAGGD